MRKGCVDVKESSIKNKDVDFLAQYENLLRKRILITKTYCKVFLNLSKLLKTL